MQTVDKQVSKSIQKIINNGAKNQPLLTLGVCLVILVLILALADSGVQSNLAKILGLDNTTSSPSEKPKSYDKIEKVQVSRVVDGDTITVNDGRTIRYLNMDTPETKKPNTPIQCFGPEASKLNKELVDGKQVWLISDKDPEDHYGRSLRFVFLAGKNTDNIEESINAYLVKNGFARASIVKPNTTYEKLFFKLEAEAKSQNLGLWGKCSNPFKE